MKKMIKFFALAAIAALACVSCNKEIEVSVASVEDGIKVAVVADMPMTKTELTSATTIGWSTGDKIDFVNSTAGEKVASDAAAISDGKATFTGTVTNTGTFYAYYPTSSRALINNHGEVKFEKNQYPTDADTFDPAADVMVSSTFEVGAAGSYSTDPATITFKRLGAFLKVYFVDSTTGSKLGGEYASLVSVQSDGEGKQQLVGKMEVAPSGIVNFVGQWYTVVAHYREGVFDVDADAAFLGVYPATLASGSQLIIKVETDKYSISKTVDMPRTVALSGGDVLPIRVTVTDGDLTAKKLQRVWSMISTAGHNWGTDIRVGDVYMNANDQARSVAMDDDNIYLPKSSAYPAIFAVSIADKSSISLLPTSGFLGTTFKSSFARIMKNEDGEVNGGKDILVVSNLSAGEEAAPFEIRAFNNGINNSSTRLAAFIWDTANSVNDWRRYGDRFFVTGTYQSGAVYCPSFNAGKSVILGITNGARSSVTQIYTATKTEGIIDATVYPGGSKILFSNASLGLWAASDGGTNNGWTTYPAITAEAAQKSFGYNFFTYKGTSYIARVMLEDTTHARLQVFEDPTGTEEGFLSAISAAPIAEAPLQDLSDYSVASPFSSGQVDCAVRIISDQVYIAALMSNGGLSLFKLALD